MNINLLVCMVAAVWVTFVPLNPKQHCFHQQMHKTADLYLHSPEGHPIQKTAVYETFDQNVLNRHRESFI